MRLEEIEVVVTDHAYDRYCERVGQIERQELHEQLQQNITERDCRYKDGYCKIGEVWWACAPAECLLILITCLGETHIDIPAAKRWERQHRDRVNLGDLANW
ncbi:hypothetical protein AB6A23_11130 [Paenibacillus tarimensis]